MLKNMADSEKNLEHQQPLDSESDQSQSKPLPPPKEIIGNYIIELETCFYRLNCAPVKRLGALKIDFFLKICAPPFCIRVVAGCLQRLVSCLVYLFYQFRSMDNENSCNNQLHIKKSILIDKAFGEKFETSCCSVGRHKFYVCICAEYTLQILTSVLTNN